MKKLTLVFLAFIVMSSCKKNVATNEAKADTEETAVPTKVYPKNVSNILRAHGGLEAWNAMENLAFTMQKGEDVEVTTTALKSRHSLIETKNHKLGFDGNDVWLEKKDTTSYKGKAKFYYNLMFYFYAMPFVLADDGITYKDVDPLEVDGRQYPGVHISYDTGVGESDGDEYIMYYDNETDKMAWLAYTVTFFSKEKSKKFSLIKYSDWVDLNGLVLPATLQWYVYKDGVVGEMRKEVTFTDTSISKEIDTSMFVKPENAVVVK